MTNGVVRPSSLLKVIDVNGRDLACPTEKVNKALEFCIHECQTFPPDEQMDCVTAVEQGYAPYPACFTADTWTFVVGKGRVTMDELRKGDVVLDHDLRPTKIIGWLHKDRDLSVEFIRIRLYGCDPLTVSPDHLLYDPVKDDFVLAAEASSLQVLSMDATLINITLPTKLPFERVQCQGVYAPLTESGTFLAQNVVASCYASPLKYRSLISHRSANAALWPVRCGYLPFNMHAIEEYIEMLCELGELAE